MNEWSTELPLPDPEQIRKAIDEADERARLLRRLLRIVMRLQMPEILRNPAPVPQPKEIR